MKTFIICEKASAGREIAAFLGKKYNLSATVDKKISNFIHLGNEFTIGWCRGHLLALIEAGDYNSDWKMWKKDDLPIIPENFRLEPAKIKKMVNGRNQISNDNGILELLSSIKLCCSEAKNIINAGDCGREGQVIVDEVLEYYGILNSGKQIKRLWVDGLNDAELEKGFNNLLENSDKLGVYRAGVVRSKTDWLFGINLTRAISINFKENLGINEMFSAGRVQTPVITILYNRDLQLKNFKEKDFYSLSVVLSNGKESVTGELIKNDQIPDIVLDEEDRIIDKTFIESLQKKVENAKNGKVTSVTKKEKNVNHPKLFSLSLLQQECNSLFKISASQTLEIAQKLYEKSKMISYPRTSSNHLPTSQFEEVSKKLNVLSSNNEYKKIIDLLKGEYFKSNAWDNSKLSDHHAIIPIDFKINSYNQLSDIEKRVFDLISKRYICHLFPPKKEMEIKAITEVEVKNLSNIELYEFSSTAKYVINPGWTVAFDKDMGGSDIKIEKGETVKIEKANVNYKKTTPPSKFTEGTLIAAMTNISKFLPTTNLTNEELITFKNILNKSEGIGTEATRAPLIENLKNRNFISLKNNLLDITDKGIELIENLLKINMDEICSPIITAKYELMLNEIQANNLSEDQFMSDFLKTLDSWINKLKLNKFVNNHNFSSVQKNYPSTKPVAKKGAK